MVIRFPILLATLASVSLVGCATAEVKPAVPAPMPVISAPVAETTTEPSGELNANARPVRLVVNYGDQSGLNSVLDTYLKDKQAADTAWSAYWHEKCDADTILPAPKLVRFSRGSNVILEATSEADIKIIASVLNRNSDVNYITTEKTAYAQY